jgi:peptidyl-prolyl cis-trans isomerase C
LAVALALGWAVCESAAQQQPAAPRPAALVNGEAISMADLEAEMRRNGPVAVQMPSNIRREVQRQALATLIDNLLLEQFLLTNAPAASPADVEKKMVELAEELKKDNKTVADFLRATSQTEAELRKNVARELRWYAFARGQATDAVLQPYYTQFKDFFDGTTVRVSHIAVRLAPGATDADVAKGRAQLEAIRAEVVSGKTDFAAAAKAHSQCPTAKDGGDVGFVTRKFGDVEEPFARAAFALKPGEISDVVRTELGLHVLKVTERKPGPGSELAKVKDDVREVYIVDLRESIMTQLRRSAKIEVSLP